MAEEKNAKNIFGAGNENIKNEVRVFIGVNWVWESKFSNRISIFLVVLEIFTDLCTSIKYADARHILGTSL